MTIYDPPSGWMCGFPRKYNPLPGESLADTLRRDGYPEKFNPEWAAQHCRFWDEPETNSEVAAPISAEKLTKGEYLVDGMGRSKSERCSN